MQLRKATIAILSVTILGAAAFSAPLFSQASATALVGPMYLYTFNSPGNINETGSMGESDSPYWWVNSGGGAVIVNGEGKTLQGELSSLSKWRVLYAATNPIDTDNGYHPQNIFRFVSRSQWQDSREEAYFKIEKDNLSASPNRNSSNGLLLFNRYQDSADLYYLGIRVDGTAVIKKKTGGTYYTLAQKAVFPGTYNHDANPNLIPKNTWIGIRSEVVNNTDGTVGLKLFMDAGKTGIWTLLLSATDDARSFGGAAITSKGYGGIRTDFMDVTFDNFRETAL